MNLLNDCSEEEQDKAMDPNRKRSTSNLSALRNCTVQAMSNLLNANIDSGLMHSIGNFNPYTATIFMPPKELWEAYSNRTVRPSVHQSVRPASCPVHISYII